MHNAALAQMRKADARFADWRYHAFDIEPRDLAAALDEFWRLGFRGINLTVPHKVLAVSLVRRLDAPANEAGAVNTLVHDGKEWRGTNTDGHGLAAAVREDLGIELKGTRVILLGAGGAARGAAAECLRAGCSGLWVLNRTQAKLDALLAHLAPIAGGIPIGAVRLAGSHAELAKGALVINATSAGLRGDDDAPVDLAALPGVAAVYDMIYNPPFTKLLEQARSLGIPHSNGLGMLVHQGAKSLEIWSGVRASVTAPTMRSAAAKALGY
jgi:shikimate dehydrogenase